MGVPEGQGLRIALGLQSFLDTRYASLECQ